MKSDSLALHWVSLAGVAWLATMYTNVIGALML